MLWLLQNRSSIRVLGVRRHRRVHASLTYGGYMRILKRIGLMILAAVPILHDPCSIFSLAVAIYDSLRRWSVR
ncbi:hypothetical protein CI102_6802 [Trichoderma harzianum]|nr:hypothetical protein CI102_6802 [Trichoderma harzianum]